MSNRLNFIFAIFFLTLTIGLSACNDTPNRSNDAAPLPADIPVKPTTVPESTTPPVEPAQSTPAEVTTESLPTETPTTLSPTETPVVDTPEATPTSEPQPVSESDSDSILVFKIAGGIAEFCDELTINQGGDFSLLTCDQPDPIAGTLKQLDQDSLQAWYENLADFHRTFEDNPDATDNLVTDLVFRGQGEIEADETQQQVIFDWVNGLTVRLRSQDEETPPTPEPAVTGPEDFCPDINRPALLTVNYEEPTMLILVDPDGQATCDIVLDRLPAGRIATTAANIYYPVVDPDTQSITVWQLSAGGTQNPLDFTSIVMKEPAPFDFAVSDDGKKIAWTWTEIDVESDPPVYRNNLRIANIDGANQVTALDQVENNEERIITPIRFSTDGLLLFYALQPDMGGLASGGRYDNLYSVTATGDQPKFLYACPADNPDCVGGIAADGSVLAVVQPQAGTIQVLGQDGGLINTLSLPPTNYVGRAAFGPTGNLAFISANLSQTDQDVPPLPNPGYISFITPPYMEQPQTLLSDNSVGALRGWLDENRLVFNAIDQEGNAVTAIITIDGQVIELSSNVAVGVLQ